MSTRIVPIPEPVMLGGRELIVSALSDRQHVALDRWAGGQVIAAAAQSVAADDPLWDQVVALAMRESVTVTWRNSGAIQTRSGYVRLIWEMSRQATAPSPTEADISDLIRKSTPEEQRILNAVFFKQNYPVKREVAEGQANPQAPA